jgi:hypothetical protein
MSDEKLCIAAKLFDCYMVDVVNLEEEHPLLAMIKRPQPMMFLTVFDGEIIYQSKQKPTASSVFSLCAKTLKKTHKFSLDKVARDEQKLLTELGKLKDSLENIKNTRLRKADKLSKREDLALQEEEKEIQEKIAELKEEEAKLLTLPKLEKEGEVATGS